MVRNGKLVASHISTDTGSMVDENNFKDIKCHPKLSLNIIKMSDKSKIKIEEEPSVSIIIAFQKPGDYLRECLTAIKELDYQDYEVILLPDEAMEIAGEGITIIPTGPVGPPRKKRYRRPGGKRRYNCLHR